MHATVGGAVLELLEGDIAQQATDAVVTAAHWDLHGGQGTDGSIHAGAGPELLAACRVIGACPIGCAVITPGFRLAARYVIHAVGPVYELGDEHECGLLASAYRASLQLAVEHRLRSIAFPSISTGAFCFPLRQAAPVALGAIADFLASEQHGLERVRLVLYAPEQPHALRIYSEALAALGLKGS